MSIVSDSLRKLVMRQIDEHQIVLWFDPEHHYEAFVAALAMPGATIARYEGSFFALRHAIEPLLAGDDPPRLLVYVPLAEEETQQALVEVAATAAVLKPGQANVQRNTRLSVVARRALKDTLGPERADDLARQVDAGKLSLADLDRLNEQQGGSAVVATIFGTSSPQDVGLMFLSTPRLDEKIVARTAATEVATLLSTAFGLSLPPDTTIAEQRTILARHIITTEFLASLKGDLPPVLASVGVASDPDARQACVMLARTWRLRRDLQESYAEQALAAEQALGPGDLALDLFQIRDCETFAGIEARLQEAIEPNSVTLQVTPGKHKTVSIHLLDATTGRELKQIDRIDVAMLAF